MTAMRAVSAALIAAALAVPVACRQQQQPQCSIPQSPRIIDRQASPSPYNGTYSTSIVEQTVPDELVYKPRPGVTSYKLHRCGQHYHFPIEHPQGCLGEIPAAGEAAQKPKAGQWVEFHTVYASKASEVCLDPETLNCCEEGPFVVRAFAAKVTPDGRDDPIPPIPSLPGGPFAEYTGSTTGKENVPDECKPEANWSFQLGCAFTVTEAQLGLFRSVDPARRPQPADRLSRDLTLVP